MPRVRWSTKQGVRDNIVKSLKSRYWKLYPRIEKSNVGLGPSVSIHGWNRACATAIFVSALFFIPTFIAWSCGVESNLIQVLICSTYFMGTCLVFYQMLRCGGVLAPYAWYMAGSGLYFGLGTALWGATRELHNRPILQAAEGDLVTINLLNSSSVMIVVITAYLISRRVRAVKQQLDQVQIGWRSVYRFIVPMAIVSVFMDYYFFPVAENLVIRSFQSKLSYILPMYLVLSGALWRNLSYILKLISLLIVCGIVLLGILSFSKTSIIYPILCLLAGYWINNRSLSALVVPVASLFIVLFLVVMPLAQKGRLSQGYDPEDNSLLDRYEIVDSESQKVGRESTEPWIRRLSRFSLAPYQKFLIHQYRSGRRGASMDGFWVALVPRALWPEKPNITRYGTELYDSFNRTRGAQSALAPTYSAEAYWNYGSVGVIGISILYGMQLGWLSRKWFYAIQGKEREYLIIAFPAAYFGLNVETWILKSLFGGFITMLVIFWSMKLLMSVSRLRVEKGAVRKVSEEWRT